MQETGKVFGSVKAFLSSLNTGHKQEGRFSPATCEELVALREKHPDHLLSEKFRFGLKQMGSLYVIDRINRHRPKRVLEMGAGNSLYFNNKIGGKCDYWMVDDSGFYEPEQFAASISQRKHTTFVSGLVGDALPDLPEGRFDLVFSVSVLEHVPDDKIDGVAAHMRRLLAPGGHLVHSLDLPASQAAQRAKRWFEALKHAGFKLPHPSTRLDFGDTIDGAVLLEPFSIVHEFYGKSADLAKYVKPDWYQTTFILDVSI